MVPTLSSGDYFLDIVQQIGQDELGLTSAEDTQQRGHQPRGSRSPRQWEADHGLEVNPRFSDMSIGDLDADRGRPSSTSLSVPVSDFAKQALGGRRPDAATRTRRTLDSLPESQRCG